MARKRLQADARRLQILEVAFSMVAEAGLENFRTRDVAEQAGINSATLHHYFPTKEALIGGVAGYLEDLYRNVRSPIVPGSASNSALSALRQEFADARFYRVERPDMLAVSAEFLLQSTRDRTAAQTIAALHQHWRQQLEAIVRQGQAEGVFDSQVDPVAASMIVVGSLWGATSLLRASNEEFERMCLVLESFLAGNTGSSKE